MAEGTVTGQAQGWRDQLALYYPRVRGWFSRVLSDPAAVDDLAQEVFARVCGRLAEGEVVINPWSFMKVVAKNVFLEYLRTRRRWRAELPLDLGQAAETLPPAAEIQVRQEAVQALPQLLAQLDEDDRCIITGRYTLGLTVRELAEAVGTSASTIMRRHNRALCQLRRLALSQGIHL